MTIAVDWIIKQIKQTNQVLLKCLASYFTEKINETVDAVVTAAKQTVQEVTQLTTDNNVRQSSTTATELIEVAQAGIYSGTDQGQFAAVTSDPDIAMDGAIVEDGTYMEVEESEETGMRAKTRKSIFAVSNQFWHKPPRTATEEDRRLRF